MDKTTVVLGGAYCATILVLLSFFVLFPLKMDSTEHVAQTGSILTDPEVKNPQLNLADLFSKSDSGVVQIIVRKSNDSSTERDIGSGIVYDTGGHIITNNHVVKNDANIRVVFRDGKSYSANVVGTDPYADLAVIKVNGDPITLHPLPLGDSSRLRIGDEVAAIGNPFGLTGSMTSGIVSQVGRLLNPPNSSFSIPDVIQTDVPINPGNSGGPLLNLRGEVIGINTAIQSGTGEFSGVGFAIPSNTMKKIIPLLIQSGHYKHPWLGISGISLDPFISDALQLPSSNGFLIEKVVPESPAAKAGLHGSNTTRTLDGIRYEVGGDIITAVDDQPVKQIDDLLNYLQDKKTVGDKIVLTILRGDKSMRITLTLEERPDQL